MAARKWIFRDEENDPSLTERLSEKLSCGTLLASVLQSRSIKDVEHAKRFLYNDEAENDPYLLPDMALAVNRLKRARELNEKTAVFGDYDADGVTATVIMMGALAEFGISAVKYLPDRFSDGYGMNTSAVDKLHNDGVRLIVTVDCGIACVNEISYAKSLGIDVIVTDHHNCPEVIPSCSAVVNPKRIDSAYPFLHLAGAGVAYKLATALIGDKAHRFLSFAAVGTVADVVSLTGENRVIVKNGLAQINEGAQPCFEALMLAASKKGPITSENIAFIMGPRINSAGRMENPVSAYELLTAGDMQTACEKAKHLNELNTKRQAAEKRIFDEAVEKIKEDNLLSDDVIVVGGKGWDAGVIGIVAARITEASYKPCVVISYDDEGNGKGSARSIEGFNLYDALSYSGKCLEKFGGHALAAGLSLKKENEAAFKQTVNAYARETLTDECKIRKISVDARVSIGDINIKSIEELSLLEPTGTDNSAPVFALVDVKITDKKLLSDGKHLKLTVEKDSVSLDTIKFNAGSVAKKIYSGMHVHLAGSLTVNDYTGRPQMIINDILY